MPLKAVLRKLLTTPTSQWTYLGSGLQMFIQGSVIAWMPSYLNRYHGMDMTQSATSAGLLVLVAGIGMTGGGVLVDRLSRRDDRNKLRVPMLYALVSAVILLTAFVLPPTPLQLVLIAIGLLIGAGFAGPSGAAICDVTSASIHQPRRWQSWCWPTTSSDLHPVRSSPVCWLTPSTCDSP